SPGTLIGPNASVSVRGADDDLWASAEVMSEIPLSEMRGWSTGEFLESSYQPRPDNWRVRLYHCGEG
ncbi:MAG: hypothetical protein PVH83_02880, partial [Methyloceanibacter sp.]